MSIIYPGQASNYKKKPLFGGSGFKNKAPLCFGSLYSKSGAGAFRDFGNNITLGNSLKKQQFEAEEKVNKVTDNVAEKFRNKSDLQDYTASGNGFKKE